MTVFELMTGGDENEDHINQESTFTEKPTKQNEAEIENIKEKIEFYSDYDLH